MAVLNHHIVAARDKQATSLFFAELLGLAPPVALGEFAVFKVSADTTLAFVDTDGDIYPLHYACLVTEEEFDDTFGRVRDRGLAYWSDPSGRGVYFDDPNGHLLEIITRPYGSGGTTAQHPHPLVTPPHRNVVWR